MDWGMLQQEVDFVWDRVTRGRPGTKLMEAEWMSLCPPTPEGVREDMHRLVHRRKMYEAINVLKDRNMVRVLKGPVEWHLEAFRAQESAGSPA